MNYGDMYVGAIKKRLFLYKRLSWKRLWKYSLS